MGGTRPFVHCAGTLTTWDGVSGVDLVMSIGPAGEVLRLWGNRVDEIRPKVRASLLKGMADKVRDGPSTRTRPPGPRAP